MQFSSEKEEKLAIQNRLAGYRKLHGSGCFAKVSKATNTSHIISDTDIYDMMIGAVPPMKIEVWRAVSNALDFVDTART